MMSDIYLIEVQQQYGIILKPDLFDLLIAVSTRSVEEMPLPDVSMQIPLSYVNSVYTVLNHAPLSVCLGELFSNTELPCQLVRSFKLKPLSEDSVREGNTLFEPLDGSNTLFYEHSLPMVAPPLNWEKTHETGTLTGGYLSKSSTSVLSFNAIRSKSYAHLFLSPSKRLLGVLNGLQKNSFKINTP